MGKIAFLFSGQGAQHTGMGESLYSVSAAARKVFDMAESLRPGTKEQCFSGDAALLSQTINTQPCLFVCDLAAARAATEAGIEPSLAAGFSLGEIAALSFSGVLSDEEGMRLVCRRAEFMDGAAKESEGAMAAVLKLAPEKVEELCSGFNEAYPVNYNSEFQTVVACASGELESFCAAVAASGGRALPLKVSGAFHSPFMAGAAEKLAELLSEFEFKAPRIPLYSNVTAGEYAGDFRELVAKQVCSPVRWRDSMRAMEQKGVSAFVEVGVGKTLVGLAKKNCEGACCYNIEDKESLEGAVSALSGDL